MEYVSTTHSISNETQHVFRQPVYGHPVVQVQVVEIYYLFVDSSFVTSVTCVIAHDKYLVSGNDKPLRSMNAVIDAFMAAKSEGTGSEPAVSNRDCDMQAILTKLRFKLQKRNRHATFDPSFVTSVTCEVRRDKLRNFTYYEYFVSGNDKPLRSMSAVIDAFLAHQGANGGTAAAGGLAVSASPAVSAAAVDNSFGGPLAETLPSTIPSAALSAPLRERIASIELSTRVAFQLLDRFEGRGDHGPFFDLLDRLDLALENSGGVQILLETTHLVPSVEMLQGYLRLVGAVGEVHFVSSVEALVCDMAQDPTSVADLVDWICSVPQPALMRMLDTADVRPFADFEDSIRVLACAKAAHRMAVSFACLPKFKDALRTGQHAAQLWSGLSAEQLVGVMRLVHREDGALDVALAVCATRVFDAEHWEAAAGMDAASWQEGGEEGEGEGDGAYLAEMGRLHGMIEGDCLELLLEQVFAGALPSLSALRLLTSFVSSSDRRPVWLRAQRVHDTRALLKEGRPHSQVSSLVARVELAHDLWLGRKNLDADSDSNSDFFDSLANAAVEIGEACGPMTAAAPFSRMLELFADHRVPPTAAAAVVTELPNGPEDLWIHHGRMLQRMLQLKFV